MSVIYNYYKNINNFDNYDYIKELSLDKFKESLHLKNIKYQLSR